MRIGINGSDQVVLGAPPADMVAQAVQAEADGFTSYWLAQLQVPDALTVLAMAGTATSTIELGTAVVPTWVRHPTMLAGQALTVQAASGGRLTLGIGLAHLTIEDSLGIPFRAPARNMDEYLSILLPSLARQPVAFEGEFWTARVDAIGGPDVAPPSVILAAMGPRLLAMAGGRADGSILWLSGPKVIRERVVPALHAAAEGAGRPAPRVVASVPVSVTDDVAGTKAFLASALDGYNHLPSYRAVMDEDGSGGPEDVSLVGDEATVREGLAAFAAAGATDFAAVEVAFDPDTAARTRALLKAVLDEG